MTRTGEARRLRKAAGISGKAMAAVLGISPGYLANIESGRRLPLAGSALAASYGRVLRGLANHEQVSRELAREERPRAG